MPRAPQSRSPAAGPPPTRNSPAARPASSWAVRCRDGSAWSTASSQKQGAQRRTPPTDPETRKVREQVCARRAAQTRFAREASSEPADALPDSHRRADAPAPPEHRPGDRDGRHSFRTLSEQRAGLSPPARGENRDPGDRLVETCLRYRAGLNAYGARVARFVRQPPVRPALVAIETRSMPFGRSG